MIGERQPLHVPEESRPKVPQHAFAGIGSQQRADEISKLIQQCHNDHQNDREDEQGAVRAFHTDGQEPVEEPRRRVRPMTLSTAIVSGMA